jgi:hypothetical protein
MGYIMAVGGILVKEDFAEKNIAWERVCPLIILDKTN